MVVQHNLTAMNSNRMLGITTKTQSKSTEKLSSGYKINRAADDAAGLAISEKMRKQIRGLTQASTNAQDGISAVQTAEGALTEVHDMLQRMNELAVKAANGTNSVDDRSYIQAEIEQLITEIDRVSTTTKFNETYLLNGDAGKGSKTVYFYKSVTTDASATIADGKTVYDADGNEYDADTLAAALKADADTKVYTNVPTAAAKGTDYTVTKAYVTTTALLDIAGNALTTDTAIQNAEEGTGLYTVAGIKAQDSTDNVTSCPVDLYNADGEKVYSAGDDTSGVDAADIVKLYTTAPTKAVKGTDYTFTATYAIETDKAVYDADGNKLDAAGLQQALEADPNVKLYQAAPTLATEGEKGDYTFTPETTGMAQLYDKDGKEVTVSKLADMLEKGDKLYADKNQATEVTEANINEYTNSATVNADLTLSLHVGADSSDNNKIWLDIASMSAAGIGVKELDVSTEDSATAAIDVITAAIKQVSEQRSALGAIQNRLEHTINNLDNVVENTTSAESVIRDTDMATEMVRYSNNNILAQAGQAMLAQANQSNQGVLSLLG